MGERRIPTFGTLKGTVDKDKPTVLKFLNVPFGRVTKRWRSAEPPQPWEGVRDATKQG